jgi:SAM-dependent methyltransferase
MKVKELLRHCLINFRNPYSINTVKYLSKLSSNPLLLSDLAVTRVLGLYDVETILDVGSGEGIHADRFLDAGKKVTCIDYGKSIYFEKKSKNKDAIIGDYLNYKFDKKFDLVWLSHVLEHQSSPGQFLEKCFQDVKLGGYIVVSVPPRKDMIVGGHVSFFNPGILIYQLILAGFDCSNAEICCYGYNISIIARKSKKSVNKDKLSYDAGDISIIRSLLPKNLKYVKHTKDISFDGSIREYNWQY